LRSVPAVVAVIEQARAGHPLSQPRELRVPLAGREAIFTVTSAQIQDEAGGLLGVCVLGTDVTELRRLQEELVTKEKLAALGEMAAGLAHQLRNALAAISGFGKLLQRAAPAESQVKSVAAEILREAKATAALLDRFLSFAQPQKLAAEAVSAADLCQEVTAAKSADLKERNITCTVNLPPGLVIQGDLHLLKQVLVNLLQNAIEAVPRNGKIEITGSTGPEAVELTISDNGPGVPKALRTRIFDPFFTTKESGTGLGLSVARKVVELHGGTLTVRDQAGGGARFVLTFPRQKATEGDAPLVPASPASHQ
jgi:two-component system sensor histidine kinase PilS (NtrC family)